MKKPICIYHGNCADGFGAAWVVRRFFNNGDIDFHAGVYQDQPPDVTNRPVILVDFSYKREVMIELARKAYGVLLIDHHKSAAEDLKADDNYIVDFGAFQGRIDWMRFLQNCEQDVMENAPYARVYSVFDMNKSGAGMAWDFFFPEEKRPALIDHIEDRDLWRFERPGTREIQAAVFSYPYEFDIWDALIRWPVADLWNEGRAIERKHHKDVAELVKAFRREMCIGGHWVPVANLPYTLTSDAGHLMCEPYQSPNLAGEWVTPPFAACYWDTPDGRVFSLRSRDDGMDVSEIAKQYGGGGHKNASGFRVSFEKAREFERTP
jgi:oligoribonuclease NrnB/cAMP/cGMP phosphodiesterase (DHH superfamily)